MLPCAANRWRTGTRLGCGQRWQAVGGEKTRCALALRQVTAGGRPSRGAEQKARCRLPEDMREAHRFRGKEVPAFAGMTLGAAQEAPSERPEGESGWQWRRRPLAGSTEQGGTTQRVGAQQRRATAVSAKGGDIKKRTIAQHFFYIAVHFTLGSTIATARRLTGENTAFPLRFFVRLVVRWEIPLSKGRGYVF